VGGALAYPLLIYGVFWLVALWSAGVAYWLSVGCAGFFLLILVFHVFVAWKGKPHQRHEARSIIYWVAIATLGALLYALSAPQSHLGRGFRGANGAGLGEWLLFYLDNAASVLLLDIPEIVFDLHISAIRYQSGASRAVTVLIRLLIVIGMVELLLEIVRSRFQKRQFYATVKECYWHCAALPEVAGMLLWCEGKAAALPDRREAPVPDFLASLKDDAKREAS
jgi:hypothetical protein